MMQRLNLLYYTVPLKFLQHFFLTKLSFVREEILVVSSNKKCYNDMDIKTLRRLTLPGASGIGGNPSPPVRHGTLS